MQRENFYLGIISRRLDSCKTLVLKIKKALVEESRSNPNLQITLRVKDDPREEEVPGKNVFYHFTLNLKVFEKSGLEPDCEAYKIVFKRLICVLVGLMEKTNIHPESWECYCCLYWKDFPDPGFM